MNEADLSRYSGILLHPTSLPGAYGIGEIGAQARAWIDWLARAKQRYWQILPLAPTGFGHSPYSALSAFAGNTFMISLDDLLAEGLLGAEDLASKPNFAVGSVDFEAQSTWRSEVLARAFARHQAALASAKAGAGQPPLAAEFEAYKQAQAHWLEDYALFVVLKERHAGQPWQQWPEAYRLREKAALEAFAAAEAAALEQVRYGQFLFEYQWQKLRVYAAAAGVEIIGDLPIFVALDSADAWAHQRIFYMDEQGRPTVQAGVPPDYFSETGQLWGNPLYRWELMKSEDFDWWVARFTRSQQLFDLIRVDHFRGFEAYWEVPYPAENAIGGRWVKALGADLLSEVKKQLGSLPIIAEDLGVITPEVEKLRDDFSLSGMAVLQFAFSDDDFWKNLFLPRNVPYQRVIYTGTHDNNTTRGWWNEIDERTKHHFRIYTETNPDESEIAWQMLKLAWQSPAQIAIAPLQDILNLDAQARMNIPGVAHGNWAWRMSSLPDDALADALAALTEASARA